MAAAEYPNPPRPVDFGWINESFQLFQRDALTWIVSILIYGACVLAVSFGLMGIFTLLGHSPVVAYNPAIGPANPMSQFTPAYFAYLGTSWLVSIPLHGFLMGGLYKMANKSVRGRPIDIGDLFSGGPTIVNFMVLTVILSIAGYVGLLACIVGTFFVVALLMPANALVADGADLSTALGTSVNAVKQDWLRAALFVFVFGLIYVFSGCCILPILVTIPMALIATSLAYRDLIGMPDIKQVIVDQGPGVWPPPPAP